MRSSRWQSTVRSPSSTMMRLKAGCAGDSDDLCVDARVGEGVAMKAGSVVFAELADVAGAEAPGLAGDDGGGGLAAGQKRPGGILDLGAALGEGGKRDEGVGGVEPDADEINLWGWGHGVIVKGCWAGMKGA